MNNENKPKFDPGWNDPPMLNYTTSNPPPKSRITNKRVAFPLNTTNSSSGANFNTSFQSGEASSNLPPLPNPTLLLDNTKDNLSKYFTSEEVKKKFYNSWNELPDDGKKILAMLTECLNRNNKAGAQLHRQEFLTRYEKHSEHWLAEIKF